MPKIKKKKKSIIKIKKKKNTKIKTTLKNSQLKEKNTINFRRSKDFRNDDKIEIKKISKQATEKREYNIKDFVVYPKHGVGKVIAFSTAITFPTPCFG